LRAFYESENIAMKNRSMYLIVVLLVLSSTLAIIRLGYAGREAASDAKAPLLPISDIHFPTRLALADEEVPLWRQDVAESLRRELIVNAYLHSHTIQLLKNAPRYFALVEPILLEEGVPSDFKYLPVIESALNPLATSPAGAVGLWQFMRGTAIEYGLEITGEVDERYHLEKATRAACRYLKKAKERFGSWSLAAAAYNAGEKNIARQIELQKETNYYDLLFAEETGRYIFRLLALKQVLEHPHLYGFLLPEAYPQEEYNTLKITATIDTLATFARDNGISYKTLKRFNPWLRDRALKVGAGKTYTIAIPKNKQAYR
jgi:hypothetical protein